MQANLEKRIKQKLEQTVHAVLNLIFNDFTVIWVNLFCTNHLLPRYVVWNTYLTPLLLRILSSKQFRPLEKLNQRVHGQMYCKAKETTPVSDSMNRTIRTVAQHNKKKTEQIKSILIFRELIIQHLFNSSQCNLLNLN